MRDFIESIKASVIKRANAINIQKKLIPNRLNFCEALQKKDLPAIIAEIKFASPSRGRIYQGELDTVGIAGDYLSHGAAALSILTEPDYFQGAIENVRNVREAYPNAPILLKDFVLKEQQIEQGLIYGANAVLLIVAFLTPDRLKTLYEYALNLGLTPLIEIHNFAELELALTLKPKIIGINHRNLNTLEIDLEISKELIPVIPKDILVIAESGIQTKVDLNQMKQRGVHGCLIGSQFMRSHYPGQALNQLLRDKNEH